MNCPQCNAQVPGDAKFCPVCGTAVTGASPAPEPVSQATESSAAASSYPADAGTTAPSKPSASSFDSSVAVEFLKKNKKAVIGAGAAVVVVLVAIVAFVMISSNVPEDVVKRDLMNTYLMEHGAVSSSYVNDSDYSITELKITGQSEEKLSSDLLSLATTAATGSNTVRRVSVSGKIANESFETSFTGYLYYVKTNDQWVEINTDVDATSTKPLRASTKRRARLRHRPRCLTSLRLLKNPTVRTFRLLRRRLSIPTGLPMIRRPAPRVSNSIRKKVGSVRVMPS